MPFHRFTNDEVDNLISSGGKTGKAEKNLFFLENALLFLKNAEAFCLERRGIFGEMPKWFPCGCFKQFKLIFSESMKGDFKGSFHTFALWHKELTARDTSERNLYFFLE